MYNAMTIDPTLPPGKGDHQVYTRAKDCGHTT
jgi:hypothetical protein